MLSSSGAGNPEALVLSHTHEWVLPSAAGSSFCAVRTPPNPLPPVWHCRFQPSGAPRRWLGSLPALGLAVARAQPTKSRTHNPQRNTASQNALAHFLVPGPWLMQKGEVFRSIRRADVHKLLQSG